MTETEYLDVRKRVLESLVRRSVEFFKKADKPLYRDPLKIFREKENLRCSLEPYMNQ